MMVKRILRSILITVLVVFFSIFLLEAVSFAVVYVLSKDEKNAHLAAQVDRFHPLWNRRINRGHPVPPHQRRDESNPFTFDPRNGYRFKPNTIYRAQLRTDSSGFVCNPGCTPVPLEKSGNEIRIFVFGGSSVAGDGVDTSDKIITAQLERILSKSSLFSGRRIRVINAGVHGYFSAQELVRLATEVVFYDPDFVIFFDGNNDHREWVYLQRHPFIGRIQKHIRPGLQVYDYQLIEGMDRIQSLGGSIIHTGNLFVETFPIVHYTMVLAKHIRLVMSGWRSDATAKSVDDEQDGPLKPESKTRFPLDGIGHNSVRTYFDFLDMAAGVARSKSIKAILCLQPSLGVVAKKTLVGREIKYMRKIKENRSGAFTGLAEFYALAREGFAARALKNGPTVRFCDLTTIFDDIEEQVFVDDIHYTELGNRIIADYLALEIERLLLADAVAK